MNKERLYIQYQRMKGQGCKNRGKFVSFSFFFKVPLLLEEFLYQKKKKKKKENVIEHK